MPEEKLIPSNTIISTVGGDFTICISYPDRCEDTTCLVEPSIELPITIEGEIFKVIGTKNLTSFLEYELGITTSDPSRIDFTIKENTGELIVTSTDNDSHRYYIDEDTGELFYDCCLQKTEDPLTNIQSAKTRGGPYDKIEEILQELIKLVG